MTLRIGCTVHSEFIHISAREGGKLGRTSSEVLIGISIFDIF